MDIEPFVSAFGHDEGHVVLAKNLDWPVGNGLIFVNKTGVAKTAYTSAKNRLAWTSKYGSITFNQYGKEFPLARMNEKGLVIEELNTFGDPSDDDSAYQLNEFQWIQYCLDNFSCVNELKTGVSEIEIRPEFQLFHYLICDLDGNVAVVEFHNGKAHFYQDDGLPFPVLSNDHYENAVKYTWRFRGFGGDLPIRKENTDGERFIRAAAFVQEIEHKALHDPGNEAFSALDSIRQIDTRWNIVYDNTNASIHFKTHNSLTVKAINVTSFDYSCDSPEYCLDVMIEAEGKVDTLFSEFTGERIYFASNLPGNYGSLDIWYTERYDTGYSAPVNIGPLSHKQG